MMPSGLLNVSQAWANSATRGCPASLARSHRTGTARSMSKRVTHGSAAATGANGIARASCERGRRQRWKGNDVVKQFIVWARPVCGADDTEAGGSFRHPVELRRVIELSKSTHPLKSSPVV